MSTDTPQFRVDIETGLQGIQLDVGESVRCETSETAMYEGQPITVLARLRSTGRWDVEAVFAPSHAPATLDGIMRRDGEGLALAEGRVGVVLSDQQAWTTIIAPEVVAWRAPQR
jgi:hypothetical protein